jgi:hypothetical protein
MPEPPWLCLSVRSKLGRFNRAEIVWTDAGRQAFKNVAARWVNRILELAFETGLRTADLVWLTRRNLESAEGIHRFRLTTQKRGQHDNRSVNDYVKRGGSNNGPRDATH